MNRTTNFIVIKASDMQTQMPVHFNEKYGHYDSDLETYSPKTWYELINSESYELGHAATQKYIVSGEEVYLISINLEFIKGDFEAACEYGIGKTAPLGQVMSWQEAKEFIEKYAIPEEIE